MWSIFKMGTRPFYIFAYLLLILGSICVGCMFSDDLYRKYEIVYEDGEKEILEMKNQKLVLVNGCLESPKISLVSGNATTPTEYTRCSVKRLYLLSEEYR